MDGFDVIVVECDEKIGQLKDFLARGACTSFDEYKFLCGEIKGLLHTREYTLALKSHVENSDNE